MGARGRFAAGSQRWLAVRPALLGAALLGAAVLWWIVRGRSAVETWQIARATPDELLRESRQRPSDLRLHAAAAEALLRAGRPSDALSLLSSAPSGAAAGTDLQCQLDGSRARALVETGHLDAGRAAALAALKQNQACIPAVFAEGLWLEANQAWRPAAQAFELVTQHVPGDPDGWYYLGVARSRSQELLSAADALNHAVRLEPRRARDQVALGNLYGMKVDYHRAAQYYRAALRLEPGSKVAVAELAYVDSAGAQTHREYLQARAELKAAQHLAPDRLDAALGALELRFGDAAAARIDLVRALCRGNRTPGLWFQLVTADRRLGKTEESAAAMAHFKAAATARNMASGLERQLALHPGDPGLELQLGVAYAASGQNGRARAAFQRLLRLQPGSKAAAQQLKVLAAPPVDPLCGTSGASSS